jgi:serine/threonine-protein kinase
MPEAAEPTHDEEAALSKRRVGEVLAGKWKLDELLGVGGMAAVYAATHQNNSKRVALKVLHPTIAMQPEVKKRFLREGYIANKVNHPGAVSVIDDGTGEDGSVYLVMELLEGESLRAKAEKRGCRIPPRELVRYVIDLLDVLAAAHEAGIVHRDLKADNVFITNDGKVKVLDFGVARMREAGDGKTRSGLVLGTPEYMPPEQARGRTELIDGRSDLWAVGAMMFKLLTGKHPHEAETPNEVLLLAMTEPAPKLAKILPDVNPKLAQLVDTALAFERDDRFADARRMQSFAREVLATLEKEDNRATAVGLDANLVVASAKTLKAETSGPSSPSVSPSGKGLWLHDKATPIEKVAPAPVKRTRRGLLLVAIVAMAIAAVGGFLVRTLGKRPEPPVPVVTSEAGADPGAIVAAFSQVDAAADDDAPSDEEGDEEDNPYASIDATLPVKPIATAPIAKPAPVPRKPVPKGVTRTPKKKR